MSSVDLTPVVNYFEPIVLDAVVIVLTSGVCLIGKRIYSWLGWKWSDDEWRVVHSALLMAAQKLWAREDAAVMLHAKFDVSDPKLAGLAQEAMNSLPGYAERLGITEDAATSLLVSKLGGLQVHAMASSTDTLK